MKIQSVDFNSSPSIWQVLHRVDHLFGQPLAWSERLEAITDALIDELEVEAIWLLTVAPLPVAACGTVRTPLGMAPQAKVRLLDTAPPFAKNLSASSTILRRVLNGGKLHIFDPQADGRPTIDADLGDILFGIFEKLPSVIIPLIANDQPVGALIFGSQDPQKFFSAENTQQLYSHLGEHLGTNLRNVHLVEQSQRHNNVLQTLNLIAQTITSSLDIDEVIERTMTGINDLLEVEAGSLLLVDKNRHDIFFKMTLRGENKQITSHRLQLGEGIAGWVIHQNKPAISNNPDTDKRFSRKIDQAIGFSTKTVLCVPLMVQGAPLGALEVLNKRMGPFNEADQELLMSMAASLGIALQNANLYEEAKERARRNEIINQITTAINTAHGLGDMGRFIFDQLGRLLPFDHLSLSLLDDARENLKQWLLTEHGNVESKAVIPLTNSSLAEIIATQKAQLYKNISDETAPLSPYLDNRILQEDGIATKISVPLITKKLPYGSLNIGSRQSNAYGPTELRLLDELAPQLAVAIEKSRLIDMMEQRTTELKRLNHLSEMLVSTTDISLIVESTLNTLPRLLPGDIQGLLVAGEEGAYLGLVTPYDFAHTNQVVQEIQTVFNELREGDRSLEIIYTKHLAGNMPVASNWEPALVSHLPILTRLGPIGVIYIAVGQSQYINDEIWRTFSLIASQIAAAVENARLFQQIEQEKARLAAILSSSTDAVLVVNRKGQIVLDNPTAWQVMGVEESQGGKMLSSSTRNEALIELFERALTGDVPTGEIPVIDGRTFYANLSPVVVGNNGIIGSVATMQDVSHFKELNQLKTDFVNSVSHDLRSPLSGILIATHLLPQMGDLNESQLELIETIENRVNGISELIDSLLDVGKIEAGIDMEMEKCNLNDIVDEIAVSLTPQAVDKQIDLTWNLPKKQLWVLANPIRLKQVIHNLTNNAIKYTPNGGQVTIKVKQHADENRIQVNDTGMGIPAADQPHIFEKFYRVRGEHVAGIKGTGLGLAITKGIVEKHHGRIWLESVFGEGSAFTVALPDYAPFET